MPKITIYVPDELKGRMDAVEGQEPNWSAVAQAAFGVECARLEYQKKGAGRMNAVAERLRASKERFENENVRFGREMGQKWASETAEYDELVRLSIWMKDDGFPFSVDEGSMALEVYRAITGTKVGQVDHEHYNEFWERWFGIGKVPDVFAGYFAVSAKKVYEEVEDKL